MARLSSSLCPLADQKSGPEAQSRLEIEPREVLIRNVRRFRRTNVSDDRSIDPKPRQIPLHTSRSEASSTATARQSLYDNRRPTETLLGHHARALGHNGLDSPTGLAIKLPHSRSFLKSTNRDMSPNDAIMRKVGIKNPFSLS